MGPGRLRPAVVAGRFYPADPAELRDLLHRLLSQVPPTTGPAPKALIAPHAGYPFSGPIAASAYAQLAPARDQITRIVLLGPSHFFALDGLATSSADGFATPLGVVPVDTQAVRHLQELPQVSKLDAAHAREHSLEVQLPFLQTVLGDFNLVPLAVGNASPGDVSQVLELLWGGPETRVIISSDLSHYSNYETARQLDHASAKAIEALDPTGLGDDSACGRVPIRGLLQAAQQHGLRARTVDLRNSGDTAGRLDRVVGYGAFALEQG